MSLGSLVVSLAANTAEFTRDMGRAAHLSAKNMEKMQREAAKVGKAIGAMFAAGVGTASVLVKQQIDVADNMTKMAQATGVGVRTLSELDHAANLSGVSTENLATSLGRLNRNILDSAAGTGEAQRAFEALGIQVKNADGSLKNADAVLAEVAEQFAGMEDGAGKSGLAMMMFGRAGASMIPMLNQGAAGIAEMRAEAGALGITLELETGQAAERFNDNLTRLNAVKRGFANQIMTAMLPSLGNLTDQMVASAKETDMMGQVAQVAANGMRILITSVVAGVTAFRVLGDSVGKVAAAVGAVARGEFRAAAAIMREDGADMASVIETAMNNIRAVWDDTAKTATAAADSIQRSQGPLIQNAKDLAAAERERAAAVAAAAAAKKAAIDAEIREAERLEQLFYAEQARMEAEAERKREMAQQNAENIAVSLMGERELLEYHYDERVRQLVEAHELEVIGQQEFDELRLTLAQEYEDQLAEITRAGLTQREQFQALSLRKQASTIAGELANITAGVAQHNRALFELNKVSGIAMAILNAYEGISLTMAKYPFPLNVAMAAAHAGAAFAQVSAIRSATFGGSGGAAPSIAGSTPATPVSPVSGGAPGAAGGAQTTIVNFSGTTDERKLIKRYTDLLNENSVDGGRLVIA